MKHIQTISRGTLTRSLAHGGCGECQTSCQSACKTSCTVANQKCENRQNRLKRPLGDRKASQ
ncbi:MAG: six-cysteine ranthipeptide SCIFF [Oscillospiraceae bacterium]|nr:six-cysteine ranthipeptide SCIFF [Oscillospiraceae bacterium]